MVNRRSPVDEFAAYIANRIIDGITECGGGVQEERGKKPGLVRRAVDFPSLALSVGVGPAMTFFLSKSSEDVKKIKGVYGYLNGNSNDRKDLCDEMKKEEGSGYAGYIAILMLILKEIGRADVDEINKVDNVMELYKKVLNIATHIDFKDFRTMNPYILEVKKVLEGLPL
ncbi:MAG: type III-B CRISPR module-associated protein Cmr5 [Sulfolobaceae archaeon]|nr:type III-B CRISPR module-associated protein Cmr5 [Sulfolobaceae archaeon]